MTDPRYTELMRRKAERNAAIEAEREKRTIEILEIEEEQEAAGHRRGIDYEIVNDPISPIVLQRGDSLLFEASLKALLKAKAGEEMSVVENLKFVLPQIVSPDEQTARKIFDVRAGTLLRCVVALKMLHGEGASDDLGKA